MVIQTADIASWRLKRCTILFAAARPWLASPFYFFLGGGGKFFVEPEDISMASLKDLCLFVRDTGLINLCLWNNIGLYNKPKAEVNPELLLTGPLGR
jgi:hypothetical protein